MGQSDLLLAAFGRFDELNALDPNTETSEGTSVPRELAYGRRMSEMLRTFRPDASLELQLAARSQHLCRWQIPRESYPMNREGYLEWRQALKVFHAEKASEVLADLGFGPESIERVAFLLQKKKLKRDAETQALEDVICLVFLRYYFGDFLKKHPEPKLIDILKKTWRKMSPEGRQAALALPLSPAEQKLIGKALGT